MPAKKSPEPFDDSDVGPDHEPLSLEMRLELGAAEPYGNVRYLGTILTDPREFAIAGAHQPGLSFECPICRSKAQVSATSRGGGPFAFSCEGACLPEAIAGEVSNLAPFAFKRRGDLVHAFPEGFADQVIARAVESTYIPDGGNANKLVEHLCRGAQRVIPSVYTGPAGQAVIISFRLEYSDDRKKAHPQVHCVRNSFGAIELETGLPPGLRPIFNWGELTRRLDAPVLVSEGEKSVSGGQKRFPECVSVTSLCGALSPHKTDWSPLASRPDVVIWPDNDAPGIAYAKSVAAHAIAAGAKHVRIVELPKGLPEGWDLGDDLPDGIPEKDLRNAIDSAPRVTWDNVKHALRSLRDEREVPPFRLPDGHFHSRKKIVAALEEALTHLDPGCYRAPWIRTVGAIYHALGEQGLSMALDWSRRDNERHRKFEEGEVERIFEMFAESPQPRPMPLRDLFWQAYRESAARDEDGKGWRPPAAVMAEAEVAAFEAEHRKLVQGNNVFIGIQERLPDGAYQIERKSEKVAESLYMSRRVFDFSGDKKVSIFKLWEENQRVGPLKLVFRPGEPVASDELNTFTGFTIKPVPGGSYKLFRDLIGRICAENGDDAEWLWNAIAYRLQFPNRLLSSAFALIGSQGSGKTTVTRSIAKLLEPYSIRISEPERFVGRNNACLEGKLFVQAEEMVLGRREDYGHKLNNYITNDVIDVEEKYRAQAQVENRLWIGMTSNSPAVVSIGPGTRRFAMYRVSDAFRGDEEKRSAHFGALSAELESGGYEALMHDLLEWKIPASFNPRNVPKTPLYLELVGATVDRDSLRGWWQEALETGQLAGTKGVDQPWTAPIPKDCLYGEYKAWCDRFAPSSRALVLSYPEWAKRLSRLLPGGLQSTRTRRKEVSGHLVQLPSYQECCDHFEQLFDVALDRAPEPAQLKSVM